MKYQRTLRCPLNHAVVVDEEESVATRGAIGVAQRTPSDVLHDCKTCDRRFHLRPDGGSEWAPLGRLDRPSTKIIDVVAQEVIDALHREVASETKRITMAENDSLPGFLERYREQYERHADFNVVIERVVD